MALHNSFQGTMKVSILHGFSNTFISKLERKHVLNNLKFESNFLSNLKILKTYAYKTFLFCHIFSINIMP